VALRGAALLLALLLSAAAAQAQLRYVGFGDSITEGTGDDDGCGPCGYPPRLEALLNGAGQSAVVINRGVGGERTPEGITRINSVIAEGGDVLLLMEGSNDISRFITRQTTLFNLGEMARKAEVAGFQVIQSTLIPRIPTAGVDSDNLFNQRTCESIRNQAGVTGRKLADQFEILGAIPNVFATHYWTDPIDRVGHPNGPGYDVMARTWFDVITDNDTVPPVTGQIRPFNGESDVDPNTDIVVEIWDFGAGIDLANTELVVNGEVVPQAAEGNTRQAEIRYRPPAPLNGVLTLALRSRDLAVPANTVNREFARAVIAGSEFLTGDIDEDGRVDGVDLVTFGRAFGARVNATAYNPAADFNTDGIVDGTDLAQLAANFGRSLN
jgi:lysophospholipase L1-like esterase